MVTDRNIQGNQLGGNHNETEDPLTFWTSTEVDAKKLTSNLRSWTRRTKEQFKALLVGATKDFPAIKDLSEQEKQKHVTFFVHGYNTSWNDAARRYHSVSQNLFSGSDSLGLCVLFTWPSDGMALGYLPDRLDARLAAPDLAAVLNQLYDWMLVQQQVVGDPKKACRAKTSLIAHSMGAFVLQKAMQLVWTRQNQPLLISLINQLLLVAADIDNDIFKGGEAVTKTDGDAIANLCYRVSALYTGRDSTLGLSAGLKHFGKRRLGRSGLDDPEDVPDNVWQVDCSTLISPNAKNVHSSYFDEPRTIDLMREVLRGIDRNVLVARGLVPLPAPPVAAIPALGPTVAPA